MFRPFRRAINFDLVHFFLAWGGEERMESRLWMALAVVGTLACAGSATPGGQGDEGVAVDQTTEAMDLPLDIAAEDFTPADEGFGDPDPGRADEGTSDLGPQDLGPPPDPVPPPDPGPPPDAGQPDPGPPPDPGPQYSETVAACIYVVEHLCDQFIKRCDDMAFNIIPDNWLTACTDFLSQQDALVTSACLQIDNIESSDPNVALIKTFGPVALRECVDNFECKWETVGVIADFVMPLIQGQKVETSAILQLVTDLCFKQ